MTVLEEIGCIKSRLPGNVGKNIFLDASMIWYPQNSHTKYYNWNWCRDEFVPSLTKDQCKRYINSPDDYRKEFFFNLSLYKRFCSFLKKCVTATHILTYPKDIIGLLSLLYLFQIGMDSHYYRFDTPLDLEEDPKSPLGWHYLRMKSIISRLARKRRISQMQKEEWINEQLLFLLSKEGKKIISKLWLDLSPSDRKSLNISYRAMEKYIQLQTDEEIETMGKHMNGIILKAGYAIWKRLTFVVKQHKKQVPLYGELEKLFDGEPQYGTRKILVEMGRYFSKDVAKNVREEVKQWTIDQGKVKESGEH